MDHPQDQQHQLETQSLNPVPNRRAINDLHFNALNTNYKNANKLNNNNNNGQAQVVQGEDSKVLLLPSNHRKFIIVPAQPGSAIGGGGSASPTSGGSTSPNQQQATSSSSGSPPSGIPVAKFEIGESSASTSSGYPLATAASKPKQFHSLRSPTIVPALRTPT